MNSINIFTIKQVREREGLYNCPLTISDPEDARAAINAVFALGEEASEKFGFFSLNTKNGITGAHIVSIGSLNQTIVHPREVYKAALINNAASILLFHNHPSGNATPSEDDINMTKRLILAGELMGIKILDHIIVTEEGFTSFRENNLI